MSHPMQPVYLDNDGVARFKANEIVKFLIDWASSRGIDMNTLAMLKFDRDDREQFAQLIGYSVSGFNELGYVSNELAEKANKMRDTVAKDHK